MKLVALGMSSAAAICPLMVASPTSAQDIGMSIFNSANSAAINIAGTNAMNAAIAAQYDSDPSPATPQEPYRWGVMKKKHAAPAPSSTAAIDTSPPVALDFRSDASVTRAVNARFTDMLSSLQPDHREQIAAELDSGTLQTQFANLLSSYGYSSRNVADVMTAYLIIAWEVVHNEDATVHLDGIGVIHRTLQKTLAHSASMRTLNDAQKQELAETLGNLTMLAAVAKNTLVQRGDAAGLSTLQQGVQTTTERFGVDLKSLRITDQGFMAQ